MARFELRDGHIFVVAEGRVGMAEFDTPGTWGASPAHKVYVVGDDGERRGFLISNGAGDNGPDDRAGAEYR